MTGRNRIRQTNVILSWVTGELVDVISWWLPELLWFVSSLVAAIAFGWIWLAIPALVVALKVALEIHQFRADNRRVAEYMARRRQAAEAEATTEAANEGAVDADVINADDEERVR
jgi:hypothetical protein